MPTYEFTCPEGHDFEKFYRSIGAAPADVACPVCGRVAERQLSAGAGLVFKGSGFYITDYGKDGKKDQNAAASNSTGSNSTESNSTESKPAESKPAEPSAGDSKSPDSGAGAPPRAESRSSRDRKSSGDSAPKAEPAPSTPKPAPAKPAE